MKRWEYEFLELRFGGKSDEEVRKIFIDKIKELGRQGWRLMPIDYPGISGVMMEREITDEPECTTPSSRILSENLVVFMDRNNLRVRARKACLRACIENKTGGWSRECDPRYEKIKKSLTVNDLVNLSADDLLCIKDCGIKGLQAIREMLKRYDLKLLGD